MAATAGVNAGFTYGWAVGASWDLNPNLAMLDSQFMLGVISMALTTPPSSPAAGDRYSIPVVGVTPPGGSAAAVAATGAWANYNGYIARYTSSGWEFVSAKEGWRARNRADSRLYHCDAAGNWLPTNAVASVLGVAVQYSGTTFGIRQLDFGADFTVTDTGSGYIQIRYGARVQVNDGSVSILATARQVAMIAITAARTLNLPASSAFPQGTMLVIMDESGACSGTNTITVAANGSDTINGASTFVIGQPRGFVKLESNGAGKWTVIGSSVLSSANGGPISGFRNRLINANFYINQRAYVSGTALAAGAYAHDRWKAGTIGCTYTYTQGSPDTVVTITNGTLAQVIESVTVEGGTYTFSWTGTATGRATYTANGASSVTTTAFVASPLLVPNVNPGTAITIELTSGTAGALQVEPGVGATPFERRPYPVEIALASRYYQRIANPGLHGVVGSTTAVYRLGSSLPYTMRATPSVSLTGSIPLFNGLYTSTANKITTNYTTSTIMEFDFQTPTSNFSTGQFVLTYNSNSGDYYLEFNAEL